MSAETAIISHIVRHGDASLVYLVEHGVKADYFGEERSGACYRWLLDQWGNHGEVPSEERFAVRWPNFKVAAQPDPLSALVEDLRAHHAIRLARDMFHGIAVEFET